MPAFNPTVHSSALQSQLQDNSGLIVVCYCAAWCDTCAKYESDFNQLAHRWPQHIFVWVDIEENPEYLGEEDVENFPTVLLQTTTANRFFGPLLPYIAHLQKLLERVDSLPDVAGGPPMLRPLVAAAAQ